MTPHPIFIKCAPLPLLAILVLALSACLPVPTQQVSEPTPTLFPGTLSPTADPTQELTSSFLEGTFLGLTYQRADGSRLLAGQGNLPGLEPLWVPLPGQDEWLVAVPYQDGSLWTAVLTDGTLVPVLVRGSRLSTSFTLSLSTSGVNSPTAYDLSE